MTIAIGLFARPSLLSLPGVMVFARGVVLLLTRGSRGIWAMMICGRGCGRGLSIGGVIVRLVDVDAW